MLALVLAGATTAPAAPGPATPAGASPVSAPPPARIVSLAPALTEAVCALGRCGALVGVDDDSNHPAGVRTLPHLGSGLAPSPEGILALHPDLVLLGAASPLTDHLRRLGLRVVVEAPQSSRDVQHTLQHLARQLAVAPDQADAVWASLQAEVAEAAASVPRSAQGLRVYIEAGAGPYAAGPASYLGEILARLGARNIVPAALGAFPRLSPEFVVRANPDVILVVEPDGGRLEQRPGWHQITAVRNGRVCRFAGVARDALSRPGPRLGAAARLVAGCLASALPDAAPGAAR